MEAIKIMVIPDTQVKPGVPVSHLEAAGHAILRYRPDVVVHLGDHWDMESVSTYSSATEVEGKRILADIEAGNEALDVLMGPLKAFNAQKRKNKEKQYKPRLIMLRGNHEYRLQRYIDSHPALHGIMGDFMFNDTDHGFEVIPFQEIINLQGIMFSHFFYNPNSGRPWAGTAHTKLKNVGASFVMGHQQGKDLAERKLADGTSQRGLVVGSFYQHQEGYRGPQGHESWHGIVMLNNCKNGSYDLMELGMDYLMERFL